MPNVRFHATFLRPRLELRREETAIGGRAVAVDGEASAQIDPQDDHALVGNDWFPIAPDILADLRRWLGKNESVGLESYIGLYRGLAPPFEVDDDLSEDDLLLLGPASRPQADALQARLYPYQQVGLEWLTARSDVGVGGILADEMGLGKTVQVLAAVIHESAMQRRPSLVVMPLTLLENWRRELHKFAPSLRFYSHIGPKRVRRPAAIEEARVDVVLTTYDAVVSDIGMLSMVTWDLVIADEAQAFKNPNTLRAHALSRLRRRAMFVMTGTPLENRTLDLWSVATLAVPGYLGPRDHFEAVLGDNPGLLRAAIRPIILRREIGDVAKDLPERIDIDVALEMFGPEEDAYGRMIDAVDGSSSPSLALITRLRQFTAHPQLVDALTQLSPVDASAKLTRVLEIASEIEATQQKAIIFVAFRRAADMVAEQITRRVGMPAWILDGRVRDSDRQPTIDTFSNYSGPAALVMNPIVGGLGLNITAASHVIHYTLEWNPAKEDQATARAWRRGQSRPVTVHRLFYVSTIDEAIVDRTAEKRTLFDTIVGPVQHESESELRQLLAASITRWRVGSESRHTEGHRP